MGLGLAERAALGVVRGLLNSHIGRFTPQELQQAINENRDLWSATPDGMRGSIQRLKNQFRTYFDKFFNQVTTELLIDWLHRDQPSLHAVIISSHINYNWFDAQVEKFKKQIQQI